MKTCVFITGTNATGKTTLAKELMNRFGGILRTDKRKTICRNGSVTFAGRYDMEKRFGGVDGFNQTKCLESVVQECLSVSEVVFYEGMYLHTFGLNLTNAMFRAEKHLLIFLYAPVVTIDKRLRERAGKGVKNDAVGKKQINCATAARKWQMIGVPVLTFDTSKNKTVQMADTIIKQVEMLCGKPLNTKIVR